MRIGHFETLRPICPLCRSADRVSPLALSQVVREQDEHVLEGLIQCVHADCRREYPIIDGIPILVAALRTFVTDNLFALYQRQDVGPLVESLVGDCCGPGSAFDTLRQQLSCYVWDHYGEFDPAESDRDQLRPGGVQRILEQGLSLASADHAPGPILDVGCSVGRTTFALAETSELVLGVDVNAAMLRVASDVLRTGSVRYDRRRVGVVYDRREFSVPTTAAERVDFWCCDATALPFAEQTFSLTTALSVLDSIQSPQGMLAEIGRVLCGNGKLLMACPYDWSTAATPVEEWLGGHSQRNENAGDSAEWLRQTLPRLEPALKLLEQRDDLPWRLRLHDRSLVEYLCHLLVAERA